MKKLAIMILMFSGAIAACAQAPKVQTDKKPIVTPAAVKKTFEQKFPNATKVKWGKENAKEWEADFTLEGKKLSANFTQDGAWVETEQKITIAEFPKAVSEAIQTKYPGWKITEADRTETAKNGLIFEADIKSGAQKKEVVFKEDGTPVQE